ncbi:hypothetical protein [Streptomyces ehimensis]|uniref:DUF3892 domain-containing protein n=1 Tax=Streptomyces ehimensis TaxID=68195 RepID=A0ABV9BX66_9ACTN
MAAFSPGNRAKAISYGTNTKVRLTSKSNGKHVAEYLRVAGGDDVYHLWNASGPGTSKVSDAGSTVVKLRACNWVPDNDDDCGGWSYH